MDGTGGVSQRTKDRFDIASKSIAIVGGIISAIALIITLGRNNAQRASELRWDQARLGMQFTDAMLTDPQAFDALRMVDWDRRSYTVGGQTDTISVAEVRRALDVGNNDSLPPTDVFVRESFDRLFYHFGKIERVIDSKLVLQSDVASPIDYYAPVLVNRYGDVLIPYMRQLNHCDALDLLHRFDPRAQACAPPARNGSAASAGSPAD